jgi:hypothetical protein
VRSTAAQLALLESRSGIKTAGLKRCLKWVGRCGPVRFDPTLSERPCIDARSKVAAGRSDQLLSLSPKSADRRLVSTDQLRLPRSTNKAVNPIRHPSAGVQTHMNHNDRGTICQIKFIASTSFFSILKINFDGFLEISCHDFSFVRYRAAPEFHATMALWKT